jgi:DNA modification methylase/predicted RNA-binding Zn-ribbon protein involved in translation (DUF1610 family)
MTRRDRSSNSLLMRSDQLELIDRSLEQQAIDRASEDVDDARRTEYLERLRAALPELRKIEGFPIGTDEDILALSDPPYYTACPNPFLGEFVGEHGTPYDEATDDYHREPFAADVSEGKNDPIYNAHSYHTKVPHKAIMRYILHYTKPGDIVFDGFCGTGMTGVAAQLCGSPDPDFKVKVEAEWAAAGHSAPVWGARRAILGDLSPAATFIAYNYNTQVDVKAFERGAKRILDELEANLGWMYETSHTDGSKARINYTVWSDVFLCPNCGAEVVFWDAAVDQATNSIASDFPCGECGSFMSKRAAQRQQRSVADPALGGLSKLAVRIPVLVVYSVGRQRFQRRPTEEDIDLIGRVQRPPSIDYPISPLPPGANTRQPAVSHGFTHVHQFYWPRSLCVLAQAWQLADTPPMRFALTGVMQGLSALQRFRPGTTFPNMILAGTLYVGSLTREWNAIDWLAGKFRGLSRFYVAMSATPEPSFRLGTASNAETVAPPNSLDYVFTDPPFGGNIMYSELNSLWEAWLRVTTAIADEAITSSVQGKAVPQYLELMTRSFAANYEALKPGRWMTVAFHNSSNSIWTSIQESIQRARFVVADVRVLDKKQGTQKQYTTANAVKQDLVISAYKPRAGFEHRFALEAGTEQGAWDFIREHLGQLPVFVDHDGRVEVVAERQNYLLYDRMVAFHIQRGATVPLSAGHFYAGLNQRFLERDDMFFTELQAAEYDRRRLEARDVEQLSVFVVDEKSAIQWIRAELLAQPQTFQDLQPKFLRELNKNRFEELPELRDILEQNFLEDASSHQWRVPDPGKQADLEALRIRALLNEFATYAGGTAKLKRFRLEAIRAGFADLWAKRDYRAIIKLAERLPDEVVQEDPALLMYYDNAVTREGAG